MIILYAIILFFAIGSIVILFIGGILQMFLHDSSGRIMYDFDGEVVGCAFCEGVFPVEEMIEFENEGFYCQNCWENRLAELPREYQYDTIYDPAGDWKTGGTDEKIN